MAVLSYSCSHSGWGLLGFPTTCLEHTAPPSGKGGVVMTTRLGLQHQCSLCYSKSNSSLPTFPHHMIPGPSLMKPHPLTFRSTDVLHHRTSVLRKVKGCGFIRLPVYPGPSTWEPLLPLPTCQARDCQLHHGSTDLGGLLGSLSSELVSSPPDTFPMTMFVHLFLKVASLAGLIFLSCFIGGVVAALCTVTKFIVSCLPPAC